MEPTQTTADILVRLEEPFASKDVKWLVAATSRDNRKGRVTPYADPRAYTDRLNEVVTPSGWTREYAVHTISPITRMKKDKAVQSGNVLVTCIVTIPGVGTHCGSGEEWADDENAMTSAEAQAFKRACSCFGLGRYFYSFGEMWVELNDYRQPKQLPNLPAWALPANERGKSANDASVKHQERASDSAARGEVQIPKGPLDATVTDEIAGFKRDLGAALYTDIL
ncbi:MAG TPA: Rad52/Rad22 family DNA repair protein [Edaphobacter sp.]|nr:Rad52/Rad22 family DNA repair protein [Edaphobacter sp.]